MGTCKTCGGNGGPQVEALPLSNPPSVSGSTCSSCHRPASSCGCQSFCEEDHTINKIYKHFGFTLRVKASFVWPALNQTVDLQVEGVDRLSPGSLLWNASAGYLHVQSFDFISQNVVAKNQGESCNTYTGGETLPECTDFVVGPPLCDTGSSPIPNIPYLAADFISPASGDCALASVTNIVGLTLNDTISMNGYSYRIGDIVDSDTIQLCNDGEGAPVGTVIYWDSDSDGIPNIPIFVIASENPCTRSPVSAGVIIVCDGSDAARPLSGSVDGQIPVWNNVTHRYELKNISAPYTVCTTLTADLIVDPVHVGSYAILVTSTSAFVMNDAVLISGIFYIVNSVDTATLMHITPAVTPGAVVTYPPGSSVCSANEAYVLQSLQTVTSHTVLGRAAAGTGPFEQLILIDGLAFTGMAAIGIAAGGVTSAMLAASAATRKTIMHEAGLSHVSATTTRANRYGSVSYPSPSIMPSAGSVTHLTLVCTAAISAGIIVATLYKNGVSTGKLVSISAPSYAAQAAITPEPVVANDVLELYIIGAHAPDPTLCIAQALGYFST